MIAKQWVGFVMIAALGTASACAQGMGTAKPSGRGPPPHFGPQSIAPQIVITPLGEPDPGQN